MSAAPMPTRPSVRNPTGFPRRSRFRPTSPPIRSAGKRRKSASAKRLSNSRTGWAISIEAHRPNGRAPGRSSPLGLGSLASIPRGGVAERPIAAVLKTAVPQGTRGSNPLASAIPAPGRARRDPWGRSSAYFLRSIPGVPRSRGSPSMPKTRLLIACQPRTGSNWLCSLLQSHPQILCHHEVFHHDEIYYAVGHRDGRLSHLGSTHERDRDPLGFLEQLWHEDFGRSVVGIKLLDGQAPEVLARLLADTQVRKLVLRRQSRVRAYVSLLRARETGFWARTSYDGVAVRVEARELLEF